MHSKMFHELIPKEAHNRGLIGYYGVNNTLLILEEHFNWPHLRQDVERVFERCIK